MTPTVQEFYHKPTYTFSYVVRDPHSSAALIVDPVLDYDHKSGRTGTASAEAIAAFIEDNGLAAEWILETHAHADHLTAAPYLQERVGGRIAIGEHITTVQKTFQKVFNTNSGFRPNGSQFDHLFADGETFRIGSVEGRVIHTPGHTPACLTYVIGDAAFVGDTLFMPDYGTARCDFPGGDAGILYDSIQKILALPPETRLFMCHDYKAPGRDAYAWETTVAEESAYNVHVHAGITREQFIAMRTARDRTLAMPVLILPSVQVNMRAGALPPPEDNGVSYLKIPVNAL